VTFWQCSIDAALDLSLGSDRQRDGSTVRRAMQNQPMQRASAVNWDAGTAEADTNTVEATADPASQAVPMMNSEVAPPLLGIRRSACR